MRGDALPEPEHAPSVSATVRPLRGAALAPERRGRLDLVAPAEPHQEFCDPPKLVIISRQTARAGGAVVAAESDVALELAGHDELPRLSRPRS